MTIQTRDVPASTARLRQALEAIAVALQAADLDGLLHAEGELELAMRQLAAASTHLAAADREAVRLEIRSARQALNRCRTLGSTLLDFVRLSFEAQGRHPGYGPHQQAPVVYGPRAINARG